MPKITPSALISEIRGKWAGSTFQMWKGQIIARRSPKPHQTPKESRGRYKGIVSDLAGCYDSLTKAQKTGWCAYADLLPTIMSGFNAFLSLNSTLFLADHPDLDIRFNAPTTYTRPTSPHPFCVDYCSISDHYLMTWTAPAFLCFYTQSFYAPQAGYSNLKYPSWRIHQTVQSANKFMSLDGSGFPAGTVIRFRARNLNIHGQTSIPTPTASATKE